MEVVGYAVLLTLADESETSGEIYTLDAATNSVVLNILYIAGA